MGVVIETQFWEPSSAAFIIIFFCCISAKFTGSSGKTSWTLELGSISYPSPAPFLRFRSCFLLVYSLSSVIEGLASIFGEVEYAYYGVCREWILIALSIGCMASLCIGSFLGILFDVMGHKKACILFCILHFLVGVLKSVTKHPGIWLPSMCLAIASSLSSFSFEIWMEAEHEKLGHRRDLLNDTYLLMSFFGSVSLIVSQALGNFLIVQNAFLPFTVAALLAMFCAIYISKEWSRNSPSTTIRTYREDFSALVLSDRRIWLLAFAEACLHFSLAVFWILWAPMIVADGREVHLSTIYPCLLGARMFGSVAVPWLSGPLLASIEECLLAAFAIAGIALSIVAYDYQEIGGLVMLFCIFHACVGLISPSLARLRTMMVPIEMRAGMISLSLAPSNAAALLILILGGYYRNLENSTIMAFAAFALLSAAVSMYLLKCQRKQHHRNLHVF